MKTKVHCMVLGIVSVVMITTIAIVSASQITSIANTHIKKM